MILNDADDIRFGAAQVDRVYLGAEQVWPSSTVSYDDLVIGDGAAHYWPLQGPDLNAAGVDLIGTIPLLDGGGAPSFGETGPRGHGAVGFSSAALWTGDADLPPVSSPAVSMELWFRSDSPSDLRCIAVFRRLNSDTEAITMVHNSASAGQARSWRAGAFRTTGAGSFNDGQWHHRVDVVDDGTYRIYVDGALLQSGATTNPSDGGRRRLIIGSNAGAIQFFTGWISHVALYPVALTAPQIAAHYAAL